LFFLVAGPGSRVALFDERRERREGGAMAIERILVPLDGSDLAEAALETAIDILTEHPATTLLLLRAADSAPPSEDPMSDKARSVREAESYLNGVAAGLRECGITRVRTTVWYGPAAPTIVEAATAEKADLIIMTSHGSGGIGRLIFGSVAESVLQGTRTPILLVRDVTSPLLPLRGAAEPVPSQEPDATASRS
jgi:nucleotide-binding universal stress UspA family protein